MSPMGGLGIAGGKGINLKLTILFLLPAVLLMLASDDRGNAVVIVSEMKTSRSFVLTGYTS